MRVYLVRHGKAAKEGYATDAERELTPVGRREVARIAELVAQTGAPVAQIRHSGLVRARQTAEIFADFLQPPGGLVAVPGLLFDDPVEPLARELALESDPVMLVGHNPFMENLAALMITGSAGIRAPLHFTTSGITCLEYVEGGWAVRWMLSREFVKGTED